MNDGTSTSVSSETAEPHSPSLASAAHAPSAAHTSEISVRHEGVKPALASSDPKRVASHFWLTNGDQAVLAVLSFVLLCLLVASWVRLSRWGTAPIEIEHLHSQPLSFHLDANSATWVEWTQLDGIGDGLARRIVADREENGPFRSVDDLLRVKGIGPKTLERLRPWVTVELSVPRMADGTPQRVP